jgi:hypothetical protein
MARSRWQLFALIGALAPAIVITTTLSGCYHAYRRQLAEERTARGEKASALGRSQAALDDFEVTLELERGGALQAGSDRRGRLDQGRARLEPLLQRMPRDGRLQLDLARLAAAKHDIVAAARHYHAALGGTWPAGAAAARSEAHRELGALTLRRRALPVRDPGPPGLTCRTPF